MRVGRICWALDGGRPCLKIHRMFKMGAVRRTDGMLRLGAYFAQVDHRGRLLAKEWSDENGASLPGYCVNDRVTEADAAGMWAGARYEAQSAVADGEHDYEHDLPDAATFADQVSAAQKRGWVEVSEIN